MGKQKKKNKHKKKNVLAGINILKLILEILKGIIEIIKLILE